MIQGMAHTAPVVPSLDCHRTRITPEAQARVIHLLFIQELSVDIVARRMGVARTTIRRIQSAYYLKTEQGKNGDDD